METFNTLKSSNAAERRLYNRIEFKNHPVSLLKNDGTSIQGFTSDLSFWGIKILVSRLSAQLITPLVGIIENESAFVDIVLTVPNEAGTLQIEAQCKVVYLGIDVDEDPKFNHTLGLHIIRHKGEGRESVRKILYGEKVFIPIN